MLKKLITRRFTTIKGLAQVIADQRKGLEERDQEINLGVDYDTTIRKLLFGVVLCMTVATATIGRYRSSD